MTQVATVDPGKAATHLPSCADLTHDKLLPCGLTNEQHDKWLATLSLLQWKCCGFHHLTYKLLDNTGTEWVAYFTEAVPVAATDARNILINPKTYFTYDLRERLFILCHEIVHNMYMDVPFLMRCLSAGTVPMDDGTTVPMDEECMQHAMDYRINALLKESNIGKPPKDCLLDHNMAKANDGICDTYRKVYNKKKKDGTLGGGQFDLVLMPGVSTGQNPQQAMPDPQVWATEIKTAMVAEQMRSQGHLPGAMQRMFEQLLNPQIPWIEKMKASVHRKVGSGSYNWKKADRRYISRDIFMPSKSGYGSGHIVIWGDTSGSIGNKELCHYMAEMSSLWEEVRPKRITVLWCDSKIHKISELEEPMDLENLQVEVKTKGVGGGGGTSVNPVFKWIDALDEKPECFIGFTDGFVTFPRREPDNMVVLWATVANNPQAFPFGEVVTIDVRAAN